MNSDALLADKLFAWCEEFDQHPAEGWLLLLLTRTITVDEMRAAVLARRSPVTVEDISEATRKLCGELATYHGWEPEYDRDRDWIVFKHYSDADTLSDDETEIRIVLGGDSIDVQEYSPDQESYCKSSGMDDCGWNLHPLKERTTDAFMAIVRPYLDKVSHDTERWHVYEMHKGRLIGSYDDSDAACEAADAASESTPDEAPVYVFVAPDLRWLPGAEPPPTTIGTTDDALKAGMQLLYRAARHG